MKRPFIVLLALAAATALVWGLASRGPVAPPSAASAGATTNIPPVATTPAVEPAPRAQVIAPVAPATPATLTTTAVSTGEPQAAGAAQRSLEHAKLALQSAQAQLAAFDRDWTRGDAKRDQEQRRLHDLGRKAHVARVEQEQRLVQHLEHVSAPAH